MAPRKQRLRKYIFVVGGVMSGVGKGIAASSIGQILQARGLAVTAIKIDPYINVDAGTMNPTEHGEVFVLADGYETDQDMGNYERFMGLKLSRDNYMTTGSVYKRVIERERNLEYHGKCVEVVPHIPLEVIGTIRRAAEKADADVTIIEIGGTIGEYQNILFLEAARMMKADDPEGVLFVLVSYLPIPNKIGEMKTKPTQYAARTLNGAGIQADFIIARAERPLDDRRKEKIAISCSMRPESVISAPDVDSIYDVPVNFEKDRLSDAILRRLHLKSRKSTLALWKKQVAEVKRLKRTVKIAIVGKYFKTGDFVLSDAYISVIESLKHAAFANHRKPELTWIDSTEYEQDPKRLRELQAFDGVLIPGGFGARGVEGKILAIEYCRKKRIPYFGICYGMQLAVIEYARHIAAFPGANTTEVNPKTDHPVIDILPEQKAKLARREYGGTMRLGEYPAVLKKGTLAEQAYGTKKIIERHRHRYEVNPEYVARLREAGMVFSGTSPDGVLMEIAELPKKTHPFFVGVQFHPEFQSSILQPHPIFHAFIKAATKGRK
ncbi:MAG: CTP synthase [Candidatus Moraniibacteriota bacterium]|nr:MAG: CTP synthase [Candidatus Moranbacteria bacterium]